MEKKNCKDPPLQAHCFNFYHTRKLPFCQLSVVRQELSNQVLRCWVDGRLKTLKESAGCFISSRLLLNSATAILPVIAR